MSPATKSPTILTEEQILGAEDLKEEVVEVPEWGGAVKLKQITRRQWNDAFDQAMRGDEFDEELFDMLILIETIVEPKLTRDRVEQLRGKSAGVIRRLAYLAYQFNNMNDGALAAAMARFQDDA